MQLPLNYTILFYFPPKRSNGSILHNLIVATQRPSPGYTLNNVTAPVLYKLIHYFMENPINGSTVLKYAVEDRDVSFYLITLAFFNPLLTNDAHMRHGHSISQ